MFFHKPTLFHILGVEALEEGLGLPPARGAHDVEVGLVPIVVAELLAPGFLPVTLDLKRLSVQDDETAWNQTTIVTTRVFP